MSRKGKRRREARRRARQRREEQPPEGPLEEGGTTDDGTPVPRQVSIPGEDEPSEASVEVGRGRAARKKRAKRKAGLTQRASRIRVSPWLIAVLVLAAGTGLLAMLILTSGSSGTTGGGASSEPTPDPRVAGLPIDATFEIEAGGAANDAFFRPNTIDANAGDVIELVVTNIGSVTHNLRVSGLDKEYETGDDFEPQPFAIKPGETGRTVVKIDPPDTYPFRCDFHPLVQVGTLILQ